MRCCSVDSCGMSTAMRRKSPNLTTRTAADAEAVGSPLLTSLLLLFAKEFKGQRPRSPFSSPLSVLHPDTLAPSAVPKAETCPPPPRPSILQLRRLSWSSTMRAIVNSFILLYILSPPLYIYTHARDVLCTSTIVSTLPARAPGSRSAPYPIPLIDGRQ